MKVISGLILFAISVPAFRWCAGEMAVQLWGVETRAVIQQVGRNEPRGRFAAYRAHYAFDTAEAGRASGSAPARRGSLGGWLRVKYLRHDPTWNTPATGWYAGALMLLFGAPAWALSFWSARQWVGVQRNRHPKAKRAAGPDSVTRSYAEKEISGADSRQKSGGYLLSSFLGAVALGLNLGWFALQERRVSLGISEAVRVTETEAETRPRPLLARGATLGNQVNGSAVAFEGESVYGAIWRDAAGAPGPEPGLYRFSRAGIALVGESGTTARIFRGVQVLDGWLYYFGLEGIHRIRTDGTRHTTLTRTRATSMAVVGETVYFQNELLRDALYRIDGEGGGERPLVRESTGAWCVADDGWIYYVNRNDDARIWRIQPDGRGRERFLDRRVGTLLVEHGGVWFTDLEERGSLCRAGTSGTDVRTVVADAVTAVLPAQEWLVLVLAEGTLLRVSRDGKERKVLAREVSSVLEHQAVLYLTRGLQTQRLHRMTLEGEELGVLSLGRSGVE